MNKASLFGDKKWRCRLGIHELCWEYKHTLDHMPYREVLTLPCLYCVESREVHTKTFWAYHNYKMLDNLRAELDQRNKLGDSNE
jgi:hypothetical protein